MDKVTQRSTNALKKLKATPKLLRVTEFPLKQDCPSQWNSAQYTLKESAGKLRVSHHHSGLNQSKTGHYMSRWVGGMEQACDESWSSLKRSQMKFVVSAAYLLILIFLLLLQVHVMKLSMCLEGPTFSCTVRVWGFRKWMPLGAKTSRNNNLVIIFTLTRCTMYYYHETFCLFSLFMSFVTVSKVTPLI